MELATVIGPMPLAVAVCLSTLYDSAEHAPHDKGVNGALGAVLTGLGLGQRERPFDDHAKSLVCAEMVILICTLCRFLAPISVPEKLARY